MSDGLSYHQQVKGGIYGQPDGPPYEDIVKLQEESAALAASMTTVPGYVPPSYGGHLGGPSNLPIIGWTVQNSTGPAFREPYDATDMGRIPDWNQDGNGLSAGHYDMNQVTLTGEPVNRLNRAPICSTFFDGMMGEPSNPSAPNTDVTGTIDLEW